jgi:hypothetical protein
MNIIVIQTGSRFYVAEYFEYRQRGLNYKSEL